MVYIYYWSLYRPQRYLQYFNSEPQSIYRSAKILCLKFGPL